MTKNITLSVDEQVLARARRIAAERNTTVNALVRAYLEHLTAREDRWKEAAAKMRAIAEEAGGRIGPRTWTRDDIYDR